MSATHELTLADVAAALDILPPVGSGAVLVRGLETDSRRNVAERVFFALTGPNFDGHDFVAAALARGAAGAVVAAERWARHPDLTRVPAERVLAVVDPLLALGQVAQAWRLRWARPLVAVTGSAGKTTVTALIAAAWRTVLGEEAVCATPGNWNNLIGVPLTLGRLSPQHQGAVLELGMSEPGEMARLGAIASPDVAVVTNVLRAHVEGLGSLEAVAREKASLYTALPDDGVAIVPADSPFLPQLLAAAGQRPRLSFGLAPTAEVRAEAIEAADDGVRFVAVGPSERLEITLALAGRHQVVNALAALAALLPLGVSWQAAQQAWASFTAPSGRQQWRRHVSGAWILDDTYNANPDAMRAALALLAERRETVKIAVLGEMAELGPESARWHEEVGAYARACGVTHLFVLGENARAIATGFGEKAQCFEDVAALVAALEPLLSSQTVVLIKGSRRARMERVVAALQEVPDAA